MGLALVAYSKPRANEMLCAEIWKPKPGVCDVSFLVLLLMWALWFTVSFTQQLYVPLLWGSALSNFS